MTMLADEVDRQRFVTELDTNFCVSASAGAGKTTAIVRRIVALARRGNAGGELERLVVVTYTVSAAAELRVRVREELFKSLPEDNHERQRIIAAFGRAFFGTIHSFCLQLLGEEGRHLQLPAQPELLEEGDERLWLRFAEQGVDAVADGDAARAVFRHYTFEQVLRLAKKLDAAAAEKFAGASLSAEPPPLLLDSVLDFDPKKNKNTQEHLKRLAVWRAQFRAGDGFLELPQFKQGMQEFLNAAQAAFMPYVSWVDAQAAALAGRLALAYRAYRAEHGRVTYDDMVVWTQRLLADEKILRRLRGRGCVVILDEAQDTHPEMFRILTELARPADAQLYAWPDNADAEPPLPGRFCFVGDEQQAIYDRSDLALYRKYVDAFANRRGGELLDFSVTMRCPRQVIAAVNGIFHGRLDQPPLVKFKALTAKPDAAAGAVNILPLTVAAEKRSVDEERRDECAQVAAWLAEQGTRGLGARDWGEVAVLAPRKEWLALAAAALRERGLPCRLVSSRERRRDLPAYSWPVALLKVLALPMERFELIGVLREIFGVSDAELLAVHRAESNGLDLFAKAEGSPLTMRVLAVLRGLREGMNDSGCLALARRLLTVTQLRGRIAAVGGDAALADDFVRSALAADVEGVGVAEWAEGLWRELDKAPPQAVGGAGEIQLLTCHKAKGLQWPVVVTLGMGCLIGANQESYPLVERAEGRLTAHFSGLTRTEEAKAVRAGARERELQRLFYVTLTRTQRLLVVPDSSGFYSRVSNSFAELARWGELEPLRFAGGEVVSVSGEEARAETQSRGEFLSSPSAGALAAAKRIWRRVLPHALARHVEVADDEEGEADAEAVTGGLEYGTWWHQTMQHFPWQSTAAAQGEYLRGQVAAMPERFRARGERETGLLMRSALREKLCAEGRHFLAEVPFSTMIAEDAAMEGVIDLVVTDSDGGCMVVDWKTNQRQRGESEADFHGRLREIYAPQLGAYAELLREKFGRMVSGCFLYATVSGAGVEVDDRIGNSIKDFNQS